MNFLLRFEELLTEIEDRSTLGSSLCRLKGGDFADDDDAVSTDNITNVLQKSKVT